MTWNGLVTKSAPRGATGEANGPVATDPKKHLCVVKRRSGAERLTDPVPQSATKRIAGPSRHSAWRKNADRMIVAASVVGISACGPRFPHLLASVAATVRAIR